MWEQGGTLILIGLFNQLSKSLLVQKGGCAGKKEVAEAGGLL